MDKKFILNATIVINIFLFFICISSFFVFNNNSCNYFNYGWSKSFNFVSITIDTPLKYFSLCSFIIIFNVCEVLLNDLASPIITFSTYNPYKLIIQDFTRFELEVYSNIIYFIQITKILLKLAFTISQFDIAVISLVSCQAANVIVIKILLNNKTFQETTRYVEVSDYNSINSYETRPINVNI